MEHWNQEKLLMHRSLRAAVFAALCLFANLALAQNIPADESSFTKFVADRLQKAVKATVEIKGPLTLSVGSMQANLDRIYVFCKGNPAGCAKEVDTYVNAVAQVHRDRGIAPTKAAVRVVVRSARYVQQAKANNITLLQARPLVEGLVAMAALDTPRAIRMLTDKDGPELGLTATQAYDLGITNLRKTLKPLIEIAKPVGSGQIGSLTGDSYHPSRLVLLDTWAPLAKSQGGVLIVAAPANDGLLYIGEDTPTAVDALRALVRNVMSQAPNPLSDVLLRWTSKGWRLVQ
jgi:uncharacterized protein YtpQ (UPF0354 family)